jgi:predicted permease
MWIRMRLWLVSLLRRRRFDADLADELAFHLRAREDHWAAQGLSTVDARRRARVEFGGLSKVRAEVADVRRGWWIEAIARDVRYGLRALRRHPGFTAMAVLSLAIGIGANAAIFGVVQAVLFRESPLNRPETLVNVYETEGGRGFNPVSHPNIDDLRAGTRHVFSGIAASTFVGAQVDRGGSVVPIMGEAVTGGAFALLGIAPHLGRAILPEDDVARGGHPVVMLSHGYWRDAFGGDPQVVGRTLRMGGRSYTIIGVAPEEYRGGLPAVTPAFYVPMVMLDELGGVAMLDQRDFHSFFAKARLAPGVTRAEAEHAASLVAASLSDARPEGWVPGEQFVFVPAADVRIYPGLDPLLHAAAWLLMAVVGLVLLLACTNLASVLLARALDRGQEAAVRRAIGATRGALARQLVVESVLLGLGGAAAGVCLAIVLVRLLLLVDLSLPFGLRLDLHFGLDWHELLDWRVLAFTAGTGIVAGTALGLVPAVQGTRADPGAALRAGGRGTDAHGPRRWRSGLVIAQVAMSLVLLVGAGLFLRSWQAMLKVDPGFGQAPSAVLSLMVARPTTDEAVRFTRRLLERFRERPGVEAVGLVWPMPLDVASSFTDFTLDGRMPPPGREAFRANQATVDGGFFEAAGMTMVEGRTFNDADRRDSQPVAVVGHAMARRFWPGGNAVGQILRRPDPGEDDLMIVGVASDINLRSLGEAPRDVIYVAYTQSNPVMFHFVARTTSDPAAMLPALLAAGREIDPDLRVAQSRTMAQHLAMSRLPSEMGAFLLSAFAVMAMTLAAIGVYGIVRHMVAMRTREIGIRMALGADAGSVARLLATGGLRLVLLGGAIGLAASLLVGRVFAALLFGIGTFDAAALVGAPIVLGFTAWLAAWLPARRASRMNPLTALHTD